MDELPELPFEQVLSYLSLEDRLKARTVSRAWRNTFDRYPVKTLCYSQHPIGRILGKNRWITGEFFQNFLNSRRFASFFDTFGQTILSSLMHLRLCYLNLSDGDQEAFSRNLNSFSQLEELDIIAAGLNQQDGLNLNLPMLTTLQLEYVRGIGNLTLEAPKLRKVKILECSPLRLEIVHGESVERLLVDRLRHTEVKNLKNLRYLYTYELPWAEPTFLSSLNQLKKFHLQGNHRVSELFEQKQQSGRADLKIYLCGLLLNGPHDPARNALDNSNPYYMSAEWLVCLAENPSRLADQIPFYHSLHYSDIENVVSALEVDVLKRFTDFNKLIVGRPVKDIQRFLDFLKNFENFTELKIDGDQPQELFDRLPENCAVQKLSITRPPSDLDFLFRLKHLIHLDIYFSIASETVRRALDELPVLVWFEFNHGDEMVSIRIRHLKQFEVLVDHSAEATFSDPNAAIKFIFEKKGRTEEASTCSDDD